MRWRLLNHGPAEGAWNMAVDETLFHSAVKGLAPPTVRFYRWSRPTLSIGFRQDLPETCDLRSCRELGIDTVRRFTGGRAVLHDRELTYCVAASAQASLRGLSVREVYRWVSNILRRALQGSGIVVDPSPTQEEAIGAEPHAGLPCFAVPSRHEITSGGRKLVGGAQRWSRRGFAQHGSVLMEVDRPLWSQVWGAAATAATEAVGVVELRDPPFTTSQLTRLFVSEFERTLGGPPSENALLPSEMKLATELAEQKYASPDWNVLRQAATASFV